jgi:SAM-dependent methyltransferase
MANARDERHRYGQHYTPREVARLLAAFAVRSPGDLVFDPSCGDGRLLEEALKLKKQLLARHPSRRSGSSDQVFGVERSASAVKAARRTGACVAAADFFDVGPGASLKSSMSGPGKDAGATLNESIPLPLGFDALIGNPPYIRQEVIGPKDKRRIETRLARDRVASPDVFWPRWSGRSDIYVYFFAHSIRFLKEHGRLVFLTASSWLDAGYGAALREFLLKNFRVIAVIESATESFFADASINTCITVLEREADSRPREDHLIRFVRFNRALSQILREDRSQTARRADPARRLAAEILRAGTSSINEAYRVRGVPQSELLSAVAKEGTTTAAFGRGWGKHLRADEVFFEVIERGSSRLRSLSKMASVRFGVKTGANEFFYVKEDEQRAKGKGQSARGEEQRARSEGQRANGKGQRVTGLLALADVASVRRGITTGANDFFYLSRTAALREDNVTTAGRRPSQARLATNGLTVVRDSAGRLQEIEAELLSPVVFSLKEIPGILLERVESQRMLFNCSLTPSDLAGTRALEYIESGERAGYHRRPTCSSREPWYSVARGMKPAPLIFPSKVGERWLVALNRARVFEDKKLYGVFPARRVSALSLAALLNSTWARYYAELTCRQMTGAQAIADIDVAVAEQILLPDPRTLSPRIKKKLEAAVVELSRRPVGSVFEEIKRTDRRRLDALTLEAIGFSKGSEREAVLDQLYEAVTELVRARLSKAK